MNLNEKLKNYLTHEENDFLKVEDSYNKKTSYLVGFEFASGSEDKISLVEEASQQVFIYLDRILEEKNEQVMKDAATKLFNQSK